MRAWLAPALTLIVPAACTIAFVLGGRSGTHAAPVAVPASSSAPAAPATPAPVATLATATVAGTAIVVQPATSAEQHLKEQIRVAYATQGADVQTPRDLDRYLDSLEQQARAQGVVTAVQVQPGMMAIRQAPYTQDPVERMQRLSAFAERMAKLSASLSATADTPPPLPALDDIRRASGDDRAALVDKYLEAARRLPPEQRTVANQQLNDLVQNQ